MTSVSHLLEVAAKYIGVGGTDNIFNTWYWGFHCYDPNRYPWCAAYQSYIFDEAGVPARKSASASGFATQFRQVADEDVTAGDVVVFNWDGRNDLSWCDHVGLVEWSDINGSGYFGTIEGNTGYGEGVVARVTRYNYSSYFTAFFRPDYDGADPAPEPAPVPEPTEDDIRYRACGQRGGWFSEMKGLYDTGGSGDDYAGEYGDPMVYLAIKGVGRYRVFTEGEHGGPLEWVNGYDVNDLEYGCAGDGTPILAVEVENAKVRHAAHTMGAGWNADMLGQRDTGGSSDTYAGEMMPIDAYRCRWDR